MHNIKRHTKKVFVAIIGGVVLLVGLVAIPYPGPGWLIVFAALAILSTEFVWARRLLHYARARYDKWLDWLQQQNSYVRSVLLVFTGCVVIVTVWLFNGYGLMNSWLHLHWDWLRSPFLG